MYRVYILFAYISHTSLIYPLEVSGLQILTSYFFFFCFLVFWHVFTFQCHRMFGLSHVLPFGWWSSSHNFSSFDVFAYACVVCFSESGCCLFFVCVFCLWLFFYCETKITVCSIDLCSPGPLGGTGSSLIVFFSVLFLHHSLSRSLFLFLV